MGLAHGVTTEFQATKGVVQDGLLLNYDTMFSGNTSTNIKDLSGSNVSRDMTINNVGDAVKTDNGLIIPLDGTDDRGTITDSSDEFRFESSSFSVGMWINPENPGQGQSTRLIGKQCNGNTNVGPYWTINLYGAGSGGVNPLLSSNGANQTDGVDSAVISYSTWSYVVATYLNGDGGTNKLYHNGSLLKTGTTAYATPFGYSANYPILFGNSGNWNNGKSYKLGPVHIYNKVLTAAEVSRNFNVMKHRFGV